MLMKGSEPEFGEQGCGRTRIAAASGCYLITPTRSSNWAASRDFSSWKPIQPETVAPGRLPDGLIEVRYPGETEPTLVLVEIESYPASDVDRQVLDDLMLIAVDRKVMPDVVSLVLKPKGNVAVTGSAESVSRRGGTRIGGSWPVVRMWELDAEDLFAAGDAGLIPWVPLAHTTQTPEV